MKPEFRITLLFAMVGVAVAASRDFRPDALRLHHDALTGRADCILGEFFCGANCATVEYCSPTDPIVVETCPTGALCDVFSLTCVVDGLCSAPTQFVCHSLGFFPDPFDCTVYHTCLQANIDDGDSVQAECESPHAYDPLSALCSKTLTDRVCVEKPIPTCTAVGQIGAQVENPNIYYLCRRNGNDLYPSLYRCQTNEIFVDNKCVEVASSSEASSSSLSTSSPSSSSSTSTSSSSSTSPASSSSTSSPSSSSSTSTSSSSTSSPSSSSSTSTSTSSSSSSSTSSSSSSSTTDTTLFRCTYPGQFPDPFDCAAYYVCTDDLIAYRFKCASDYHYETDRGVCEMPACTN